MAANLVNYAGTFVMAVFISRILGVTALGEFTFIFAFTAVLSVITDFGLSTLLIRKLNEDTANISGYISKINLFKVTAGFISVLLLLTVMYFFSPVNFNLVFTAGIAAVIPKAVQGTYESSIRALMNQLVPSIIKSANTLVQLFFTFLLLVSGYRLLEVMVMILGMEIITALVFKFVNIVLWSDYGINTASEEKGLLKCIKDLLKESFPFFGNSFLALSIPRITVILLGYISFAPAVGIFSAASRFANSIGLLSGALFNSYYPVMAHSETSAENKYALTKRLSLYAFGAGLLIAGSLYVLSDFLINITFKIPEAVPVLKILAFTVVPVLTYTILQSYLFSVHKEKFILKLYAVLWSLNIIISVLLIKMSNFTGAAIASIIIEYALLAVIAFKFFTINSAEEPEKIPLTDLSI
jgi:O-antigen/teichoic acid export membrane protein